MTGAQADAEQLLRDCADLKKDTIQSDVCAERLEAFGDPLRLRITDILRAGKRTVGDILEAEVVMVSHHLQILKHADLVEVRLEGLTRMIHVSGRLQNGVFHRSLTRKRRTGAR